MTCLLDNGADINKANIQNSTPLHFACRSVHTSLDYLKENAFFFRVCFSVAFFYGMLSEKHCNTIQVLVLSRTEILTVKIDTWIVFHTLKCIFAAMDNTTRLKYC